MEPVNPNPLPINDLTVLREPNSLVLPVTAQPLPTRARKLHVGHFAFMRSVVQGLDVRASWERYLRVEGDANDVRTVRATIAFIRGEFAAAARRESRPGTARLVLIDVARLGDPGPVLPSLESFAIERGLEDFSQAEQLEAFEAEFGRASQRLERRSRLIARQLEALRWLEELIAQPPRAGDAVGAWFHPVLAGYLEAAGLVTLAQLIERINGVGRRWAGPIKAIGPAKAQRLEDWLREHRDSLGLSLGSHVAQRRTDLYTHELNAVVLPATDIRPLEKFVVPAALDGSTGKYRRPQAECLLSAQNDYQAILTWISAKQGLTPEQRIALRSRRRDRDSGVERTDHGMTELSHTQRAYRREAERFLLWAIVQRGKALSSMTQEDCIAYREFLADPQPADRWCGDRGRERWSPLWRPFEGPLSKSSQRQALTILRNLYGYLADQNYLMGNPWSGVHTVKGSEPSVNAGRSFTKQQWVFIEEQLKGLEETSSNRRLTFALHLLYATGLRLSEVVAAKVEDLSWVSYPAGAKDEEPIEGWLLRVIGKGGKLREVPVPIDVISELAQYLVSRGLDPDPEETNDTDAYLLAKASDLIERAPGIAARLQNASTQNGDGLAPSTLYDQFKKFFSECSVVLNRLGDQKGAVRFLAASTHWLRHTHASHAIAGGMPIEMAQQNLGHASLATTTAYVTTERSKRMQAVEGFWTKR